jgi:hypothetical protein
VGLKRGPLSLVRISEELLEWKSTCSGSRKPRLMSVGIRCADHATPSSRKSWHELCRQAAVSRSVGIVRLPTKATEFFFIPVPYIFSVVIRFLFSLAFVP